MFSEVTERDGSYKMAKLKYAKLSLGEWPLTLVSVCLTILWGWRLNV